MDKREFEGKRAPEFFVQSDVSQAEGIEHLIRAAKERMGGVDILVNNVGSSSHSRGDALALSDDDWHRTFETNLFSVVRLDRGLLPGMIEQRSGAIVHVTSIDSGRPIPELMAYSSAKAAVTN